MNNNIKKMLKDVLEDDELWTLAGRMAWRSVGALIEAGFTREEAIQVFLKQGPIIKGG